MAAFLYSGIDYLILSIDTPYDNINDPLTLRDDLASVRVWYSTTQGFNPLNGEGTLAFNGLSLSITLKGLTPNTRYYVRYALVSAIDTTTYTLSNELTEVTDIEPVAGKTVSLAPTYNAFVYNAAGASPSPGSSTITASTFNFTSQTPYFEWYLDGVLVTGNNTNTLTYTPKANHSDMPDTISVKVRDGNNTSPVVAEDSLVMFGVIAGSNAISIVNYNPAHSLFTSSAGVITYTGSGTAIQVLEGANYLTVDNNATPANGTFKVTAVGENGYITPSSTINIVGGNTLTYGNHSNMTQTTARIVYTITVKDSTGTTRNFISYQNFTQSIAGSKGDKGDRGDDGAPAKILSITADSYVFSADASNAISGFITLTANKQNTTNTVTWSTTPSVSLYAASTGGSPVTTGNTVYLRASDYGTNTKVTVTANINLDGLTDSTSIIRIRAGENAVVAVLSNPNHPLPSSNDGTVSSYTDSGTTIQVYQAGVLRTITAVTATGSSITAGSVSGTNSTTVTIGAHSNITADSATIKYDITYTKQDGTSGTTSIIQTVYKNKQGTPGIGTPGLRTATGYLYYALASATAPTVSPGTAGSTVYNFDGTFISLNTNWSKNAPVFVAGNNNKYWAAAYTAIENSPGSGVSSGGNLIFGSVQSTIGFTGLVTFTSENSNQISDGSSSLTGWTNTTTVDGTQITTGYIKSQNYSSTLDNGTVFASAGTRINLLDGTIVSPGFRLDSSGNAGIKGSLITGTSGSERIELNVTSSNKLIVYNSNNEQLVTLGSTPGTNNAPILTITPSASRYQDGLRMTFPDWTPWSTSYPLPGDSGYRAGLILRVTGDSGTRGRMFTRLLYADSGNNFVSIEGSQDRIGCPNASYTHDTDWLIDSHSDFVGVGNWRGFFAKHTSSGTTYVETYLGRRTNLSNNTGNYGLDIVIGKFRYNNIVIEPPPNNTTTYLRGDGTWQNFSGGSSYTLPLAANGTRGGVQIGYSTTGRNYAVQLDANEKMYVNVPWTDTDSDTVTRLRGTTSGIYTAGDITLAAGTNVSIGQSGSTITISSSDTVGVTSITAAGGISGGTITTTGTISLSGTYTGTWAVTGAITATGEITAYSSDRRLKTNIEHILNPIDKIKQLNGVTYNWNNLATTYGFDPKSKQAGLLAQEVEAVLPEAVKLAPFDIDETGNSRSGESYKTIQYEKLIPLLIEAIKDQQKQIDQLKRLLEV